MPGVLVSLFRVFSFSNLFSNIFQTINVNVRLTHKGAVTLANFSSNLSLNFVSTRVLTLQSYSLDGGYTGQRFLQFV